MNKLINQNNYNATIEFISKTLYANELSPEGVQAEARKIYPEVSHDTMQQLHIQFMQRYMRERAPALYAYKQL